MFSSSNRSKWAYTFERIDLKFSFAIFLKPDSYVFHLAIAPSTIYKLGLKKLFFFLEVAKKLVLDCIKNERKNAKTLKI